MDFTNTIITTYKGFRLNSCDMDINNLIVAPNIPDGWSVEDPASEETLAVTKTALAADALVRDIQHAVAVEEPTFDVRTWLA